jgi:hypothetical protein
MNAYLAALRQVLSRPAVKLAIIMISTVLITWYRRPDQFTHPYIWVEDGAMNIHAFYQHGWWSIFLPYPSYIGYFAFPTRLIFALAATSSFRWLPEMSFYLTLVFECFVIGAVALCPTKLRYRLLCALSILLIPTDAEVFGVSLYTGWWGSLLCALPLFWREERSLRERWLRLVLVVVGGFSSPIIIAFLPAYGLRFALSRSKQNAFDLVLATIVASAQALSIALHSTGSSSIEMKLFPLGRVIDVFLGYFVYQPLYDDPGWILRISSVAVLAFIAIALTAHRKIRSEPLSVLLAAFVGVVIITTVRSHMQLAIHPVTGGPRYFFVPFVLLSWILIQLAAFDMRATRFVSCVILFVAASNMLNIGPRYHAPMDWRWQVDACSNIEGYHLPFHFDGVKEHMGIAITSIGECRYLITQSLFDNVVHPSSTDVK